MIIECPRHEGSFDCTPFCDICQGRQEYKTEGRNPETNKRHTGEQSKICLVCATENRLFFMPCLRHYKAINPETCEHNLTGEFLIHNGHGKRCFECNTTLEITPNTQLTHN